MRRAGHRDDAAALGELHHADALARARADAHGLRLDADDDAVVGNQNDVVVEVDHLDRRDVAVLADVVVQDALAAAALQAVILDLGKAAVAGFGNREHKAVFAQDAHADDHVVADQADRADAAGLPAHFADVVLVETDRLAVLRRDEQVVLPARDAHPAEHVVLGEVDRDQAVLADVRERREADALDDRVLRDHDEVAVLLERFDADHRGDLLLGLQRQQVGDVDAAARSRALRHLIALEPVDAPAVGEEQNVIVAVRGEQLGHDVLVAAGHAGNAAPAAALRVVRVERLALRVAEVRQRDDAALVRDQVFDVHFAADRRDLRAALVAEFLLHLERFVLDDAEPARLAADDVDVVGDLEAQRGELFLDLRALEAGELAEAHLHDGLRLHVVEAEARHQRFLALGDRLRIAQDRDDLVDEVERDHQAVQNVGALLRLFQLVLRAAQHDLALEADVFLQDLLQRQRARLPVDDREHDDAERHLHLRERIQVVQDDLRRSVALDVDDDVHAVAVRMVVDVRDAVEALLLDEVRDALDQPRLVDLVRQLGDDDLEPAVRLFNDLGAGAHVDLAAARAVGGADARAAHDDAAGREVRPLDVLHQAVERDVGVVDHRADAVEHLAHIVRGDIRRHADRDAGRAVDEDVREVGGQDARLLQAVVVVRVKIDGVLVDVPQHLDRELAHPRLGVSVGGRGVAVDGAEVAVAVHEHVAHRKILREAHERVVHRNVAVRVVAAEHGADRIGALSVRLFRPQAVLVHRVQDAPVHGL